MHFMYFLLSLFIFILQPYFWLKYTKASSFPTESVQRNTFEGLYYSIILVMSLRAKDYTNNEKYSGREHENRVAECVVKIQLFYLIPAVIVNDGWIYRTYWFIKKVRKALCNFLVKSHVSSVQEILAMILN